MNKAHIVIHDRTGKVQYDQLHTGPSTWDELTRDHLMAWAGALSSKQNIGMGKLILAAMLLGIPEKVFICISLPFQDKLRETVEFLFGKNQLYKWLIPSIWFGVRKYHGPKHGLANITVHEYGLLEYCYEQFDRTKNIEYLDTMAAILYRPCRFWGVEDDIRVRLTTKGYTKRAKRFQGLPAGLKTAIYLNYEGCRHSIQKRFKVAFESPSTGKKGAKPTITPWPKIIESGSNDIFGPHESTKNTLLYDFLSRLCSRVEEMKRIEAQN